MVDVSLEKEEAMHMLIHLMNRVAPMFLVAIVVVAVVVPARAQNYSEGGQRPICQVRV